MATVAGTPSPFSTVASSETLTQLEFARALRHEQGVRRFPLVSPEQGGSGVTIVEHR